MTEMSPSGTMARTEGVGAAMPLVELRLFSDAGEELPWDGEATGELQVRGPHVAAAYYKGEPFADRWLPTAISRGSTPTAPSSSSTAKDLVKSGGEWISSAQLETAIAAHPNVREAAVIAI